MYIYIYIYTHIYINIYMHMLYIYMYIYVYIYIYIYGAPQNNFDATAATEAAALFCSRPTLTHIQCDTAQNHTAAHTYTAAQNHIYGVASSSRLLKNHRSLLQKSSIKRRYSAQESYDFTEPTNRSHPIAKI